MPTNPFIDVRHFLTGTTGDYLHQGNWRYLILVLFWTLLLASIAVAVRNWQQDPTQRTGTLPVSDGLQYWTEQESTNAAFEFHRTFLKDVVLPNMKLFGPIVFLAELAFATSMLLGLSVRLVGVLAAVYTLQLWLGLYGNSSEWPWTYMFLALLMFWFALEAAGRSLGFDAWLRRTVPAVREGKGLVGWFFNVAG